MFAILVAIGTGIAASNACAQARTDPRQADQALNQGYQQVMRKLPPAGQKNLREAQRAWLNFVEKNTSAMRTAAEALGIPISRCQEMEVQEVEYRTEDFSFQSQPSSPDVVPGHLARVDADLNAVYQRCIALLPPPAQTSLREAQRAWIAYRDSNRAQGVEYVAGLTVRRADQLTDFYITGTLPAESKRSSNAGGRTPPDPFERAR